MSGTINSLIEERGKIYGEPELSHENIGLAWTGLIQQHYGLRLDHPLPAWLVELMMAAFKVHRSARVFHADNFDDLAAYSQFAREHQEKAFEPAKPEPVSVIEEGYDYFTTKDRGSTWRYRPQANEGQLYSHADGSWKTAVIGRCQWNKVEQITATEAAQIIARHASA